MKNNYSKEELREKRIKKEKFRVMKNRVIAAGVLVAVGVGLPIRIARYKNKDDKSSENEIGYSNFTAFNNLTNKVKDNNFVVLDVGDYDSSGAWFTDKKIKYCNENDISLGIVINSDSKREVDIYNDVEYVKELVSKYKIDFPVYLDIDKIITDNSLNVQTKTKLIKDFLEKCSANNIYVGVYGSDTNLCRLKKYCGIKDYDAYLVMDSDTIKYDGQYNLFKNLEGKIISRFTLNDKDGNILTKNMASALKDKNLNNKDRFSNDGSYTISKGEDILDVAFKFGLSVNELLEFNGLKNDDILPDNYKLRIPSIIEKSIPVIKEKTEKVFTKLDNPIRGCDLSYAQGSNHDWNKLKQNFKYIIARCSQGLMEDDTFEYNVKNCNLNNISVGVYCYNDYNLKNCASLDEFIKCQNMQADYVLSLLKNKKIDYPVYLDIEESAVNSYDEFFSKEYVDAMLDCWKSKIEGAGFVAGIYCNKSMYNFLKDKSENGLSGLELWIAGGSQYTGETEDIPLEEVIPSFDIVSDTKATMVQSTDSAIGAGASNGPGHLDINYSNVDYSTKINRYEVNDNNESNWKIKESTKTDKEDQLLMGMISLGVLGIGGTLIKKVKLKDKKDLENKTERNRKR